MSAEGQSPSSSPPPSPSPVAMDDTALPNPYQPPATESSAARPPQENSAVKWPGIGRPGFTLLLTAALLVAVPLQVAFMFRSPTLGWISQIPVALVLVPRLWNIGFPGWLALVAVLVTESLAAVLPDTAARPVIFLTSLLLVLPCLVLPPGYRTHRTLDRPAHVMATLALLFVALLLGGIALIFFQGLSEAGSGPG